VTGLRYGLVLRLSLFGPAMGVLTLFGIIPDRIDQYVWMVISVLCAVVITKRRTENPFFNAFAVGFVQLAVAQLIQGVFCDAYIAHNPGVLEKFADKGNEFDLQFRLLRSAPLVAVVNGVVLGLITFFLSRAAAPKKGG
jgi:hypothetical protein